MTDFRIDTIELEAWDEHMSIAAVGALHALADLGASVSEDVAVCGFDDTIVSREYALD